MTVDEVLQRIRVCESVKAGSPADLIGLREQLRAGGMSLPEAHLHVLANADGLTAYGGYFRLFNMSTLLSWNEIETWKFAWPSGVREFVCFGTTGWGDQYAYRAADLRTGGDPVVYFLEAIGMQPEELSGNFAEFLEKIFLRNSISPYDDVLVAARHRHGDLDESELLAYVPSPLISGEESIEHALKMPARAAMIANGDLASQLGEEPALRPVGGLEPYTDEQGRTRLRVIWADN